MNTQALSQTIDDIVITGKGILAADESLGTIGKRFDTIATENTEENRRAYRSLLATTPHLGEHISGVILFEETLLQKTEKGESIPEAFAHQGIVPGIKVDKGLVAFNNSPNEKITQGLDSLAERLPHYKMQGARFAKWRDVFSITDTTPSQAAIDANADVLAEYAKICQAHDIVPIVEPEVLMDGNHSIERCHEASITTYKSVFSALTKHGVKLEFIILKPNMIVPGKNCADQSNAHRIAELTLDALNKTVPAAVPSINFLSGGQSPVEATVNLNAINSHGKQPWYLSFSYGRALQEPCLAAWKGDPENVTAAQDALLNRAKLNGAATTGAYQSE